jgi:cbb3-type cytochrome oxidase maturation protein
MTVIVALIALSLLLGGSAVAVFLWALRNDQFDDLDGAAQRILFEDDPPR